MAKKTVCSLRIAFFITIKNESISKRGTEEQTLECFIFVGISPTRHMDHPTVAVLHQVSGLTVDSAGRDTVTVEEV